MTNTVAKPDSIGRSRLPELLFYFLCLGLLGFGGPVALVGQMERELVAERGWLRGKSSRKTRDQRSGHDRHRAPVGRKNASDVRVLGWGEGHFAGSGA
jgi:hypothetical protein